jgi:hypothetical protein
VAQPWVDAPGRATHRLRREVGLVALVFASLGSIIGAGWLFAALYAASLAGPAAIISWLIGGSAMMLLALGHAELGATYPVAGGNARFPHYAFGRLIGFTSGWVAFLGAVTVGVRRAHAQRSAVLRDRILVPLRPAALPPFPRVAAARRLHLRSSRDRLRHGAALAGSSEASGPGTDASPSVARSLTGGAQRFRSSKRTPALWRLGRGLEADRRDPDRLRALDGPRNTLHFGWDVLAVALLSLTVYAIAIRSRLPAERALAYVGDLSAEAEPEPSRIG